jgi:hypothetical protein
VTTYAITATFLITAPDDDEARNRFLDAVTGMPDPDHVVYDGVESLTSTDERDRR